MKALILLRGLMGLGLGAELVAGFSTMTEFVPRQARGKWVGTLSAIVVSSLPITALASTLLIPRFGWRIMFILGGLGALGVWYLRKALPESPRWLESVGRTDEAEAILQRIDREGSLHHPPPPPASATPLPPTRNLPALISPPLFPPMLVGSVPLIGADTLIYAFATFVLSFFVQARC